MPKFRDIVLDGPVHGDLDLLGGGISLESTNSVVLADGNFSTATGFVTAGGDVFTGRRARSTILKRGARTPLQVPLVYTWNPFVDGSVVYAYFNSDGTFDVRLDTGAYTPETGDELILFIGVPAAVTFPVLSWHSSWGIIGFSGADGTIPEHHDAIVPVFYRYELIYVPTNTAGNRWFATRTDYWAPGFST